MERKDSKQKDGDFAKAVQRSRFTYGKGKSCKGKKKRKPEGM